MAFQVLYILIIILFMAIQYRLRKKITGLSNSTLLDKIVQIQCIRKMRQLRMILIFNLVFEVVKIIY